MICMTSYYLNFGQPDQQKFASYAPGPDSRASTVHVCVAVNTQYMYKTFYPLSVCSCHFSSAVGAVPVLGWWHRWPGYRGQDHFAEASGLCQSHLHGKQADTCASAECGSPCWTEVQVYVIFSLCSLEPLECQKVSCSVTTMYVRLLLRVCSLSWMMMRCSCECWVCVPNPWSILVCLSFFSCPLFVFDSWPGLPRVWLKLLKSLNQERKWLCRTFH